MVPDAAGRFLAIVFTFNHRQAPESEETIAQLVGGGEATQYKIAADIQAGETADVGDVIGELEETEIFQKFAGHDIDRVRQINDLRFNATAGHGLGYVVTAVCARAHRKWRECDRFIGGRRGGGLGEQAGRDQQPKGGESEVGVK